MCRKLIKIVFLFTLLPFLSSAVTLDSSERFFVESDYDKEERRVLNGTLQTISGDAYFFVDKEWWGNVAQEKREEYQAIFYHLGKEFTDHIYPKTKDIFGTMPTHSVSRDNKKLTVLFHPMRSSAGGYVRTGDQYSMYRYSRSNQRNIVYLNTDYIESPNMQGYLAHEYMHLVTFNAKNKEYGTNEDLWLNELRSEMIITLLGYNDKYSGSNLEQRVESFLRDSDISLIEWRERVADYGMVNVFGHYLKDHYGESILSDSLHTDLVGIDSINYALQKKDKDKTFQDVFTDFIIALYLNDCSYGEHYCFLSPQLKDLKISPSISIVSAYDTLNTINYRSENWSGSWHHVIGREGNLYFNFNFNEHFTVPYVLCSKDEVSKEEKCSVSYLRLDEQGEGSLTLREFNSYYRSFTLMPIFKEEAEGLKRASFTIEMRLLSDEDEKRRREQAELLRERIDDAIRRLDDLYQLLEDNMQKRKELTLIKNNLSYGMTNSKEVRVLQEFLKEEDVYPEGLITGNFYNLTKQAVIRLQEKYYQEILTPLGLSRGTGFVGPSTRQFINSRLRK